MIVDRRVFVGSVALAALTPALGLLPSEAAVPEAAAVAQPTLMISGWSAESAGIDDQIWMRVGLGWKTAWR